MPSRKTANRSDRKTPTNDPCVGRRVDTLASHQPTPDPPSRSGKEILRRTKFGSQNVEEQRASLGNFQEMEVKLLHTFQRSFYSTAIEYNSGIRSSHQLEPVLTASS